MATTIKLKNSVTTTAAPSTLVQGETAVNITDKKVWVGDASSTPVQILGAGAPVSGTTGTFTGNTTVAGTFAANGGATLGDASGDALTINSSAVSIPNGLNFDGGTFAIDTTNNRVGVGTASPSYQLHLTSSAFAAGDGSAVAYWLGSGGRAIRTTAGAMYMDTGDASDLIFRPNVTERMRIDSSGNVGIGTASPATYGGFSTLTLNGSTGGLIQLQSNGTNTGRFYAPSATNTVIDTLAGDLLIQPAGSNLVFGTGSTERMRIDSSGNVGIGTSSPNTTLTISGSTYGGINLLSRTDAAQVSTSLFFTTSTSGNYLMRGDTGSLAFLSGAIIGSNGGTERMRLDSSGNLGLGVTPSAWDTVTGLQVKNASVYGYANEGGLYANAYYASGSWRYIASAAATGYDSNAAAGQHRWYTAASGTAGNAITFTQAMTLDASGNLLLGTTTAYKMLTVNGNASINNTLYVRQGLTDYGVLYANGNAFGFESYQGAPITWATGSGGTATERMRIDSSGNLLVGTTTASGKFVVSTADPAQIATVITAADAGFYNQVLQINCARGASTGYNLIQANNSSSTECFKVSGNGNVLNTNNSYGALSDAKLKENIVDATPKLEQLCQVKVRNYNLIGDSTKQLGVVAQELEEVFPSMIEESPDRDSEGNVLETTTKSVKYSVFVPMLIKAIQEQQAIITDLKARIETLESK